MKELFRTSKRERISFALFMGGQALFNQFLNGFGQVFLTDAGLSAATVGTIFLCTRVFDAANDPIFGGIVDRVHLKGGKFLPWLRLSAVLLPLLTLLLFFLPAGLPRGIKVAWVAVFYVGYSIAYTINDVPIYSMVSAITDQVQERVHIMSHNSLVATTMTLVIMVIVPLCYPEIGWFATALIVALPAALLLVPMGRNAQERYVNKDPEPVTLGAMFRYLKNNRFLLIFFSGLLILNTTNTTLSMAAYFTTHNLGNPKLTAPLSLCMALPAMGFALVLPRLTKRFDKFYIFVACVIGQLAVSVLSFFAGYDNLILFVVIIIFRGVFWGGNGMMMLMFTSDFIEYGEFTTGKRLQGTAYSIQTFVCKLMTALSGALGMFVLAASGFVEGSGAAQSDATLNAIWILLSLAPGVGALASLPVFLRYKLRDKDVQLMAKVNMGEISKTEAEREFSHSYT